MSDSRQIHQNTQEWLQVRRSHIGASDAPVIMGKSPWKSAYRLWEEKLGLAPASHISAKMKRGIELEDKARLELEKMTGLFFLPEVKFHRSIGYMMASLDAIDPENKHIAEIKCPNSEDHAMALSGQVPEKYVPQLQHQLEVCELDTMYYFSFDGVDGALVKVYRDDQYIQKILEKERIFWECLQDLSPPELSNTDYAIQDSEAWETVATKWISISQQLENLKSEESELRNALIHMASNKNAMGSNIKLTRYLKKGNIEYSKIPELQSIDLEQYRKKPSECFRLSFIS